MIVQIIIVFMLIRIIRIILAIDYSNIFLDNKNKKALLVTVAFVYLPAVATDVIFDSLYIRIIEEFIIIYLIVYTYEGDIIRKLILSVMNVALCGVSDIVTSYIMSGTILIQNGSASSEFVSVLLLYLCILIIKNMYKVKFAIFPEDIYKRLDQAEKERFSNVVFTKAEIGKDGVAEITAICTSDSEDESPKYRRRYL